jgi:hypothetical protein
MIPVPVRNHEFGGINRSICIKQITFWHVMVTTGWLPLSPLSGLLT